jgi:hypothetical protein
MKVKILLIALLFVSLYFVQSQEFVNYEKQISANDSVYLVNLPKLHLPEKYKGEKAPLLEYSLDNSQLPYFRPVFNQFGWSCGQASTIGYSFTYEINRLRNIPSDIPENQYPPQHAYNFYNEGENGFGVCFLYTFDAIKHNGTPNVADYGGMGEDLKEWKSGYDIYYNGMFNRIDNVYSIYVGDEDGLLILKNWLNDHLDGSDYGSIANFYTDLSGYTYLPSGTPEAGKAVITEFGNYTGHSMTFIGWNDSVRFDYNNDGQYTNNIDINGDGVVTMKDWEIGAVRLVNSWGDGWADEGFCYVMYKVLAEEKQDGGIWNKSVTVFDANADYEPQATFKIKLMHNSRNKIKVIAGVSSDISATAPEYSMDFPIFNYQGGDNYMQGGSSVADKTIEFGLDVTSLLSYVNVGESVKFFFEVRENDPDNTATGEIVEFSLMDYTNGVIEIPCSQTNVPIVENGLTTLSVIHSLNFDKVNIDTESLPPYVAGGIYTYQMEASGGVSPYKWDVVLDYTETQDGSSYPVVGGNKLSMINGKYAKQSLDFDFPFYGNIIDTLIIHENGFIMFRETSLPLPYQVDDMLLFKYEPMIAPLLNKDMNVPYSGDKGIWYEGNENYAAFRFKATLEDGSNAPVDFTVMLYPDGEIEFYYSDLFPSESSTWITGVSKGDAENLEISSFSNIPPLEDDQKLTFSPLSFPNDISIDNSGLLTIDVSNASDIYDFAIRVTGADGISDIKNYQLSTGLSFTYSVQSGGDDQLEYGETAFYSFEIVNSGGQTINNVELTAHIDDEYITMIDTIETVGNIGPGGSASLPDAISFQIAQNVPDLHSIVLIVDINSDNDEWKLNLDNIIYAPALQIGEPVVIDNDDNRLDPGEIADIQISVSNSGHADAVDVTGLLSSDDPYITFNSSGDLNFGLIPTGEINYSSVNITVDEYAPVGHVAEFVFQLNLPGLTQITDTFGLIIGRFPVYVIDLDPELLSGPVIVSTLEELDVSYGYSTDFPDVMDDYENLIVVLGRKFGNYVLTESQGEVLAGFLDNGGNIYMEGGLTWSDDPQTVVHPMFNVDIQYIGWHLADSVFGVPGTFTNDMIFSYSGEMQMFNYRFVPLGFAYTIITGSNDSYAFMVANNAIEYKTVASTIDFGGLDDNLFPSTRKALLARILDFFGLDGVITSNNNVSNFEGVKKFYCSPNPASDKATFVFNNNKGVEASLDIFDLNGNIVKTVFTNKMLSSGENSVTVDLKNVNGNRFLNGVYLCRLKSGQSTDLIRLVVISK